VIAAAAPASTANLGPGFDAAGAALDLWNEATIEEGKFSVEIAGEGADELPRDATNVALRAFALFAPPDRYRFRFTNRIPLDRGLGSSASAIGLGLVAGARAAGREPSPDELLALAERFEGHIDNVAAALCGGVCVAWRGDDRVPHARRLADAMPGDPIAVVPSTRTSTAASRTSLPAAVPHADAATTAGAAMLLGAAVATGDATLFQAALRDRLHEQYRAAGAPLLARVRAAASDTAIGVTLSGSGPTVIAWAEPGHAATVARTLEEELAGDAQVLHLRVAGDGARA
jgi:homoserine kinase